jgi:23S rRNA (adenine2503-C2)-methyltransferase
MCPKYKHTADRIRRWADIKNEMFNGQAGLQLSINSTSDEERNVMFDNMSMSLEEIAEVCRTLPAPIGRKYCLNFAYASGNEVDGVKLAKLFNPEHFMVKITPIHNNIACAKNGIATVGGYDSYLPYREAEESFKNVGFDVLVFVPSQDEEDGLITCGNAILGGSELKIESTETV